MSFHRHLAKQVLYPGHFVEHYPPENYSPHDDGIFYPDDFASAVRDVHSVTIPHAAIVNLVILSRQRLLHEYCRHTPMPRIDSMKSRVKTLVYPKRRFKRAFAALSQWGDNYFHWLTEVYPSIVASRKFLEECPILLPQHYLEAEFIREGLQLVDVEAISYRPREVVLVDELSALNQQAVGHYNAPFLQDFSAELVARVKPSRNAVGKVYLTRRKAVNKTILNERELTGLLSALGFAVVCMEDLTFAQQIELMQGTRLLVSAHGAGLTNSMFMPRGAVLYELKAHNNDYNCYFSLARTFDLRYYYRRCASDGDNFKYSNICVDLEALRSDLEGIMLELDECRGEDDRGQPMAERPRQSR